MEYVKYISKSKDINIFSHDINSLHLKKVHVKSMAWRNLLGSHSQTACGEEVHEVISEVSVTSASHVSTKTQDNKHNCIAIHSQMLINNTWSYIK